MFYRDDEWLQCPATPVSLKTNDPNSHPPSYCRRDSQRISVRRGVEMGLSSPSGDNRGKRGSERLSRLPKVAQQEGGLPAHLPLPELEQESQGSSHLKHPKTVRWPFKCSSLLTGGKVPGNVDAHFAPSYNSQENDAVRANGNMGKIRCSQMNFSPILPPV